MTLKELKERHPDIILDPVGHAELEPCANGAVFFYASLSNGKRPPLDRKVLWAGHVMTAGMRRNGDLLAVRITSEGNAKQDLITRKDMDSGRAALFRTAPITAADVRNLEPWNHWE